jgi:DNA-binding MarR family transcriptional regulator
MSKKQEFIKMVEFLLEDAVIDEENFDSTSALEYFEAFKMIKDSKKEEITENGKNILLYMQKEVDNKNNLFSAKQIAEGLFSSSRAVSGAMRKLVSDGYVEKLSDSPIVYAITDKGRTITFN